jgi:hypothetical protein
MASIFSSLYKIPTSADVSTPLGAESIRFNTAIFLAQKSKTTPNTQRVFLDYGNGSSPIFPGAAEMFTAPHQSYVTAADFSLRTQAAGDGILCLYSLISDKTFSDIELTLEQAIVQYLRTIAATLDDCSFTTGISPEERTADNINVHVTSATERTIGTRVCDCEVTVQVRSQVGKVDENNRYERHRLRTSYVRDMILADETPDILASLQHKLHVYDPLRDVVCSNNIEDRTWVSEITFTITVSNTGLN